MKKFETVNCAICHSDNLEKITSKGQFGFPTNVCICKDCGLSFLNPRWNHSTYLDFYTNEYDKFYRSAKMVLPPEKNPYSYYPILLRVNKVIKAFRPKRILDVGSGDGSQISVFQKHLKAAEYFAIEPSDTHKNKLENQGITFVANDIDSAWDKNYKNSFDFVIMRHVMEHFLAPETVLRKVKETLSDDGLLYIAVPDSLNAKPPFTDSFFRVVHTYYFNRFSMKNLLHKAGFEVVEMKEGDELLGEELFLFARKSKQDLKAKIDPNHYKMQQTVFVKGLAQERTFSYKLNRVIKTVWNRIVKVKKRFFPKPIV